MEVGSADAASKGLLCEYEEFHTHTGISEVPSISVIADVVMHFHPSGGKDIAREIIQGEVMHGS